MAIWKAHKSRRSSRGPAGRFPCRSLASTGSKGRMTPEDMFQPRPPAARSCWPPCRERRATQRSRRAPLTEGRGSLPRAAAAAKGVGTARLRSRCPRVHDGAGRCRNGSAFRKTLRPATPRSSARTVVEGRAADVVRQCSRTPKSTASRPPECRSDRQVWRGRRAALQRGRQADGTTYEFARR